MQTEIQSKPNSEQEGDAIDIDLDWDEDVDLNDSQLYDSETKQFLEPFPDVEPFQHLATKPRHLTTLR